MERVEPKEILRRHGLRARKSLGQHFLHDDCILAKITGAAELDPDDLVIEIGPGIGSLTKVLLGKVQQVIAVELDNGLASLLKQHLSSCANLKVVTGDIRNITTKELLQECGEGIQYSGECVEYKVVANLPYYVASLVIRKFLESPIRPNKIVAMVQKEVGHAMVATPGYMGLISLAVQVYGRARLVADVPADKFYPIPKVDSAVVCVDVYPEPIVDNLETFFAVAKAGFSAPRKQIHNSLAQGLDLEPHRISYALEQSSIDGRRRPSTLSILEWKNLAKVLS